MAVNEELFSDHFSDIFREVNDELKSCERPLATEHFEEKALNDAALIVERAGAHFAAYVLAQLTTVFEKCNQ